MFRGCFIVIYACTLEKEALDMMVLILIYSLSSCDESIRLIETLYEIVYIF